MPSKSPVQQTIWTLNQSRACASSRDQSKSSVPPTPGSPGPQIPGTQVEKALEDPCVSVSDPEFGILPGCMDPPPGSMARSKFGRSVRGGELFGAA